MKLKRFATVFIAAVMAFAVLGTPLGDILPFIRESVATTAGAESYGDYTYKVLDDGTVEITGYSGSEEKVWATSRLGIGTIMYFVLRKYQEVPINE